MLSISAVLPGFPQTRAPWPVWRGSVAGPVRFRGDVPQGSREALAQGPALGSRDAPARPAWRRHRPHRARHAVRAAVRFPEPSHRPARPVARRDRAKAGCCRRAVVDALARLRDLGLLHWQRRCEETRDAEGRFRLRQRTNAYGLLPPSQWRGYRDNDPPPPDPATLGAPEPIPDPIEAAVAEITSGQRKAAVAALEADPRDRLAMALAALGRAMMGDPNLTECICCQETLPRF